VVETGKREKRREGGEEAILVGVTFPGDPKSHEHPLDELARLADTAGAVEAGRVVQKRQRPDPSTFLGKGKAEEAAELARETGAKLVITDADLSPAQLRNLEKILDVRVVDRTELILDIFALHARTHQAKLQVELAQAQYILPRLRRMWTHLSREGGTGQAAAIGSRGPGEKQIEIDRRLLRRRISELKAEIARISERRERMAASRSEFFKVSLVGYTNAGKSTLLHRLTGRDAYIADQLFATLDTQTRAWTLGNGKRVFLSDTVGFIRRLPHHLVASFYATLEEVRVADLILHVVDGSHPDASMHMEAVEQVLTELAHSRAEQVRRGRGRARAAPARAQPRARGVRLRAQGHGRRRAHASGRAAHPRHADGGGVPYPGERGQAAGLARRPRHGGAPGLRERHGERPRPAGRRGYGARRAHGRGDPWGRRVVSACHSVRRKGKRPTATASARSPNSPPSESSTSLEARARRRRSRTPAAGQKQEIGPARIDRKSRHRPPGPISYFFGNFRTVPAGTRVEIRSFISITLTTRAPSPARP